MGEWRDQAQMDPAGNVARDVRPPRPTITARPAAARGTNRSRNPPVDDELVGRMMAVIERSIVEQFRQPRMTWSSSALTSDDESEMVAGHAFDQFFIP